MLSQPVSIAQCISFIFNTPKVDEVVCNDEKLKYMRWGCNEEETIIYFTLGHPRCSWTSWKLILHDSVKKLLNGRNTQPKTRNSPSLINQTRYHFTEVASTYYYVGLMFELILKPLHVWGFTSASTLQVINRRRIRNQPPTRPVPCLWGRFCSVCAWAAQCRFLS